jgi:hypothetical protein
MNPRPVLFGGPARDGLRDTEDHHVAEQHRTNTPLSMSANDGKISSPIATTQVR